MGHNWAHGARERSFSSKLNNFGMAVCTIQMGGNMVNTTGGQSSSFMEGLAHIFNQRNECKFKQ